MGNWKIVVPEAATNLFTNPSFELDAIGAAAAVGWSKDIGTETFLIDTVARFGARSLKVVTAATSSSGPFSTVTATTTALTQYTATFYAIGSGSVQVFFVDGGAGSQKGTAVTLSATNWTRVSHTATFGNGASRAVGIITSNATAATFWVDGAQLEAASYATTYIDGDQPGGTWAGLRHLSTSSRAANYRLGGREYDIETQYGLRVRNHFGAGSPDHEVMTQDLALQPGSVYLRDRINARTLTLVMDNNSTSLAGLHSRRKAFWNVIKPDALGGGQPFLIGYSGAASGKTVYSAVRYAGGWGIEGGLISPNRAVEADASVALRLLAVDPFWYADDAESATIDYQDSIASNNYALARIGGAWQNLGTGFNGIVICSAIDKERGRVYFGGSFTTANGVTVNGVTYWNGTTFVAMGATAGVAGGAVGVYTIAVAPNGDLWVGGDFTSAGGSTADGLARWNVAAGTWTAFTNGAPGDLIASIAIDKNGLVYIGGTFANWDGNANEDNIASYNGTAFAPLSTGTNGLVRALEVGLDGTTLYVGGNFTTPQTRLMTWNGSAFSAMGGGSDNIVYSIFAAPDGNVYAGGDFTTPYLYIAKWNGSAWSSLYNGLNGAVYTISNAKVGIYVGGNFTTGLGDRAAQWNGSRFIRLDADLPGTPIVRTIARTADDSVFVGYDSTGTALASGRTTVTALSTAEVYPVITITGTTTAASTSTLQWLENQTTGERLYFSLVINTGEIITIDLRPQSRKVTSNWRGQIFDQPLPTSDFSSWHLVTGANTVAAFMTGTITGATMTMNWAKIHASIDGEAA
ncbi:MAG: phage tail family protein [Xanthomonadales bacterium]|nr:phage tail family protein [Xanthomonadales bacterium]